MEHEIKEDGEVELKVIEKKIEEVPDQQDKKDVVETWVRSLLDAEFYVQYDCGATNRGETNMFCAGCRGNAFCERCRNEHNGPDHKVIKVYRSSHATCFRKEDIKKMMNISLIQSFINNSHRVIYIRPRRSNGHRNGVRPVNRCVICSWELKSEADIYCSISCKVEGTNSRKGWKVRHKGKPRRSVNGYGLQRMSPY